uniref:Integrase_H2C2 domain-containing protein n=1 Tax=Ascaris lumbricoides TaxID=6252 RepID=A0A0M3ISP8_ASCLU
MLAPEDRYNNTPIKVLGVIWDAVKDTIKPKTRGPSTGLLSKRSLLQFIAIQFDPLGYLSPTILPFKILLQDITREGSEWDEEQLNLGDIPRALWSDSKCALAWIKSPPTEKLPRFVQNRLNEIKKTTSVTMDMLQQRLIPYTSLPEAQHPETWLTNRNGGKNLRGLTTDHFIPRNCLLRQAQSNSLSTKDIIRWDLRKDETGLWRCGGRLSETAIPRSEQYPIFLLQNHRLTQLHTLREHMSIFHGGAPATLTRLRQYFWIPQGRRAVKLVIAFLCRRWKAKPFALPPMPPLPAAQVQPAPAFDCTGTELLGPTCFLRNWSYEAVDSLIYMSDNARGAPRNR